MKARVNKDPDRAAMVVMQAINDAPKCDVPVIVQEGRAIVEAAIPGGPADTIIKQALAQRDPELAAAIKVQEKHERARQIVQSNVQRLQRCFKDAEPLRVPLVSPVDLGLGDA